MVPFARAWMRGPGGWGWVSFPGTTNAGRSEPHTMPRQTLIIDADDTLWENNIYFEQAFDDFVMFLNHEHLSRAQIQDMLDELELANRASHGYGARAFARSLRDTFRQITGVPNDHPDLDVGCGVIRRDDERVEHRAQHVVSLVRAHVDGDGGGHR